MRKLLLALLLLNPLEAGVKTGAEQILDPPFLKLIKGKRVGLITNQTGINSSFESTWERLNRHPEVALTALFAPEHGFHGFVEAGEEVQHHRNIYSLYGETRAPTAEMLSEVDVLVYDIQDVGSRFYTFTTTMFESMKAASKAGLPFVVLDRPAAIGGVEVEGPPVASGFESFVGIVSLPNRFGMTLGELATMLNTEAKINCELTVVPLRGWKRELWYDQTDLPWVTPSPNMPTLDTAAVYPGLCLIEGTNLSEGRGTTHPFEWIGAPWLNHQQLVEVLNAKKLPGVHFRPQMFTPASSKHKNQACNGIQVHVTDRNRFQSVRTVLHVLEQTIRLHPDEFEFLGGFDRLAGNAWIREQLSQGTGAEEIIQRWQAQLKTFNEKRKKYLLYK